MQIQAGQDRFGEISHLPLPSNTQTVTLNNLLELMNILIYVRG